MRKHFPPNRPIMISKRADIQPMVNMLFVQNVWHADIIALAKIIVGCAEDDINLPKPQPNFYAKVYAIVEQIPIGKVTTYGAIAEVIGMKGSSRMVGHALGALSEGSGIPAQRVINRIGALSGAHHFGGYERMRSMLRREGVTFKKELVDMEKHFWDPKSITN